MYPVPPQTTGSVASEGPQLRLEPSQTLVLYDGNCGICSSLARWMNRLDRQSRLLWLPSQTPDLATAAGLTVADTDWAVWAILPNGERRAAAAAIFAAVDQVLPGALGLSSRIYRRPGARHLADAGYRWLSRNRHRLPGLPACGLASAVPPPSPEVAEALRRRVVHR